MAGFRIVPFIATHVKMNFFSWSYEKKVFSLSELANLHETTDIKLLWIGKIMYKVALLLSNVCMTCVLDHRVDLPV